MPRPAPEGTPCRDRDDCRTGKTCASGVCGGGTPAPDGTPCTDASVCTLGDHCTAGVCGGDPLVCGGADACHEPGQCDPNRGCSSAPLPAGTPCDDGDPCTEQDSCALGACSGTLRAECRHPGFVCYATADRRMAPATLSLDHRWDTRDATLVRTVALCNPTSATGAFVAHEASPLVCYDEGGGAPADREVRIENRFGEAIVTLGRPAGACLPSWLEGTGPPPAGDAFACYRVRDRRRLHETMTLADRFGSQAVRARRLRTVCAPSAVNGGGVRDARTGLACYELRTKRRPSFLPRESALSNVLGERTVDAARTRLLCVPTTLAGCGRLVSTATAGTTGCGGPALEPPPVAPFSGALFDAAGAELAGLGLGCLHYGGGDSEYYPSPLAPAGATSIYELATCEGAHRVLLGSAGSGPADCTLGPGPRKACTANPRVVCADDADCGATGGACNPVPRCFAGLPLPVFGAVPSCVLTVVAEDGGGWVDVATGAANFGTPPLTYVYLTFDQTSPCPRCVAGRCLGGQRSGGACTPANADGLTHDCPPSDAQFFGVLDLRSDLTVGGGAGTGRSEFSAPDGVFCAGQDDAGAFGRHDARRIVQTGSPAGDLRDGLAHPYVMASTGCIPASGNPLVDDFADLPGPSALSAPGTLRLVE